MPNESDPETVTSFSSETGESLYEPVTENLADKSILTWRSHSLQGGSVLRRSLRQCSKASFPQRRTQIRSTKSGPPPTRAFRIDDICSDTGPRSRSGYLHKADFVCVLFVLF